MNVIMKEKARKWALGLMTAGLLVGGMGIPSGTGHAAASTATSQTKADNSAVILKWNGAITKQTGLYREGKVWVPVAFMRDILGLPLSYDKESKTYTLGTGLKKTELMVYGKEVSLSVNHFYIRDYEGRNLNNRLYVPLELLTDYLGYRGDWSAATGRLNLMHAPQNNMKIANVSYEKKYDNASLKLDYPQLSGVGSAEAQKAINDTLKQSAMAFLAGAEKDLGNRDETGSGNPYEYQGDYIVTYNQNGIISILSSQYAYTGGAHGMTYRQAYTFSLKDGKRLLLGDLFGANPNYKKLLNAKLGKLLKAEGGYLGGFNGLNTEKYFYLKEGKVTVFFQLYEYTAYASGFPEYTFSFKELLPDGSSPFAALK